MECNAGGGSKVEGAGGREGVGNKFGMQNEERFGFFLINPQNKVLSFHPLSSPFSFPLSLSFFLPFSLSLFIIVCLGYFNKYPREGNL